MESLATLCGDDPECANIVMNDMDALLELVGPWDSGPALCSILSAECFENDDSLSLEIARLIRSMRAAG